MATGADDDRGRSALRARGAVASFVVALIAGSFGFFESGSDVAWIAKALFGAFLIIGIVWFVTRPRRI